MLRFSAAAIAAAIGFLGIAVAAAEPAVAGRATTTEETVGVDCPSLRGACFLHAERGPSGGSSAAGAAADATASDSGEAAPGCYDSVRRLPVACHDPERGWWDPESDCYHMRAVRFPPVGDPIWGGRTDGAIYVEVCPYVIGSGGSLVWFPEPPPGMAPSETPASLAQRAIELLPLAGPDVRMAPDARGLGLVGVPVWMWTQATEETWGPVTRTATIPGLTVSATARATRIVWSMGDGATVVCSGPGTPYRSEFGDGPSPDCGHVFRRSSAREPDGRFQVTATTTWRITWAGGGSSGSRTVARSSSIPISVGELQVLVR